LHVGTNVPSIALGSLRVNLVSGTLCAASVWNVQHTWLK